MILLGFRIGGIFGWRVHVESDRWPIASVCKFVFRARGMITKSPTFIRERLPSISADNWPSITTIT